MPLRLSRALRDGSATSAGPAGEPTYFFSATEISAASPLTAWLSCAANIGSEGQALAASAARKISTACASSSGVALSGGRRQRSVRNRSGPTKFEDFRRRHISMDASGHYLLSFVGREVIFRP